LRRFIVLASGLAAILVVAAGGLPGLGQAQEPEAGPIDFPGLFAPRDLSETADGELLAVEIGTAKIWRVGPEGPEVAADGLPVSYVGGPEGNETTGVSGAVQVGDTLWFVVGEELAGGSPGFQALYRLEPGGEPEMVADFFAYEQENNVDGETEPLELLSNPYDLLPHPEGGFFVADSGANAVYRVTEDGTITPYAVFTQRENPDFNPDDPSTGGPLMDQVPTGMVYGPDGALYVSTLTGYPFPLGGARVYRLEDVDGDGDAMEDGETTIAAEGLTMATAVAFDTDGSMLVTSFNRAALVPFLPRGNSGGVFRVRDGVITKVTDAIGPTGILVTSGGTAIVADHIGGTIREFAPEVLSLAAGGNFIGWTSLAGTASDFFSGAETAFVWDGSQWVAYSASLPEALSTNFAVEPGSVIFVRAAEAMDVVIEPVVG